MNSQMSKKHKHAAPHLARTQLPRRARVTLQDAVWLSQRNDVETARDKLEALNKQFPHHPDILTPLLDVLLDLKDMAAYQEIAEQLVELAPDDPDLRLNLAGSYATNLRPVSALHAFRQFVAAYPNHPRANEVRQSAAELEAHLPEILADVQLTGANAQTAALLHERSLALLERGEHKRARRVIEELLALAPDLIPALNNLSNLLFVEGDLARAAATAQRVLEREPENIQALSNLTRFLCLQGRVADAQTAARKLKTVDSARLDAEVKQIEALAMLGDDAGILEIFARAEQRGNLKEPFAVPLVFHAAGVAALRQGDEKRAKKLWQRALAIAPTFEISRANLDDLKNPIGERHAPWTFTLAEWVPRKTLDDLNRIIRPALKRRDAIVSQAVQRFLREHPEVAALVPLLLDHGDPGGREFAFRIASASDSREMQRALSDFALSMRGPDELRMQAARVARSAGLLPADPARLFLQGEWREILLLDFEITGEPELRLKPATQKIVEEAIQALHANDARRAEALLRQAIALEPDDPSLHHNLALSFEMQGRSAEAEALVRENHARHPEYLFGRTGIARMAVQNKKLEEAEALLKPLLERKRFHFTEFAAFAGAQIDLFLAKGDSKTAQAWFDMWSGVDPENSNLHPFRLRLSPLGRFLRR